MKMKRRWQWFLFLVVFCLQGVCSRAFQNPVCPQPTGYSMGDPLVFYENGVYYLYPTYEQNNSTTTTSRIWCWLSGDLVNWGRYNAPVLVKNPGDTGLGADFRYWISGPMALYKNGDDYYLAYNASTDPTPNGLHGPRILLAKGPSPYGPFQDCQVPLIPGMENRPHLRACYDIIPTPR